MSAQLIHHHRVGAGSPLVLIHGLATSWQCWKPVIPALASRHDVIAVDLPGFGGSVDLGIAEPSLEHFADSVLELLDDLGIDDFHVVGNSLGGAVSTELLGSGRVRSFTGISPAGRTQGPYLEITKALLRSSYYGARAIAPVAGAAVRLRPLRIAMFAPMIGKPGALTAAWAKDMIEGCAAGTGFSATLAHAIPRDRPVELPPYDGPAQLLWGTRDWILPLSATARFAAAWPGLEIRPLQGLGHVPMCDDPRQVADLVLAHTAAADAAVGAAAATA